MGRGCKKRRSKILIITASLITALNLSTAKSVKAQGAEVDATVRIPICGDGVAEYPEECDGTDLANQTCTTFGYTKGTLTCTSGCLVDTSECILVQTEEPETDSSDDDGSDSSDDDDDDSDSTTTSNETDTTIQTSEIVTVTRILRLPRKVANFDTNNDNRINLSEINTALLKWANSWRTEKTQVEKDCDINEDNICNVTDFSILLYHMNQ